MAFSLLWLPDVLLGAGLKVAKVDGWQTRGRGDVGSIVGVICHHTAGGLNGNMPSLRTLVDGRPGLPGPLAQLGLGRDGTFYIIAAGRSNHAGRGLWEGNASGNTSFIGIEAENTGLTNDPWPSIQLEAYARGVAALLKHIRRGSEFCAGHKEYALPRGRKPDPSFDMRAFRERVAAFMSDAPPPVSLIPQREPAAPGSEGRPTLRRGAIGDLVRIVQRAAGVTVDGRFGSKTEAAVRALQRRLGLVPDGIIGPKTWRAIDAIPTQRSSIIGDLIETIS